MRPTAESEIAVFRDDDATAARLETPAERVVIAVAVPDDEDVLPTWSRRERAANV
jgi:hypothetical protein